MDNNQVIPKNGFYTLKIVSRLTGIKKRTLKSWICSENNNPHKSLITYKETPNSMILTPVSECDRIIEAIKSGDIKVQS